MTGVLRRGSRNSSESSFGGAKGGHWTGVSPKASHVASSLDTEGGDRFQRLVEELHKEHQCRVQELRKENVLLKRQLNSVLSAHWRVAENGCKGMLQEQEGELFLSTQVPGTDKEHVKVQANEESMAGIEKGVAFQVRHVWASPDPVTKRTTRPSGDDGRSVAPGALDKKTPDNLVVGKSRGCVGRFITPPFSTKRVIWDIVSTVLLLYDLIFIPIGAFDSLSGPFFTCMDWVTLLYWTADMVASFLTGFVSMGITIMSPERIAMHYLVTWFIPDIVIVGLDWSFNVIGATALSDADSTGNIGRLLRVLRIARIVRLLRLGKLRRLKSLLTDHIKSEVVFLVLAVVQYVVLLLLVNHLICSGWWAISTLNKDQGLDNWIDENELAGRSFYYRYVTALHWSLGNFALGYTGTEPMNGGERTYAILVLVFGMILFASFTGSITNKLMQLRDMQGETSKQFWLLRRYLHQHSVPKTLVFRILRYTEYASANQRDQIQTSALNILGLLSEQLRSELDYIVSFSSLHSHPLFREAHNTSEVIMYKLTSKALSLKQFASEDIIFEEGMSATHMYYVVDGLLRYVRPNEPECIVSKEDCLAEHALWVPWYHRGETFAATECPVISVDAAALGDAVKVNARLWSLMAGYARNFAASINSVPLEDLTDLSCGEDSHATRSKLVPRQEDIDVFWGTSADPKANRVRGGAKPAIADAARSPAAITAYLPAWVQGEVVTVEPPGTMPPPLKHIRFP